MGYFFCDGWETWRKLEEEKLLLKFWGQSLVFKVGREIYLKWMHLFNDGGLNLFVILGIFLVGWKILFSFKDEFWKFYIWDTFSVMNGKCDESWRKRNCYWNFRVKLSYLRWVVKLSACTFLWWCAKFVFYFTNFFGGKKNFVFF